MRSILSDLELELLKYLDDAGVKSSREAAQEFGEPRGYARTTVATLLERLREKGYVQREKRDGAFRYSSLETRGQVTHSVIERFVGRTLGGSAAPLVAYLVESDSLTESEISELRKLLDDLEKKS